VAADDKFQITFTGEITVKKVQEMGGDYSVVGAMLVSSDPAEAYRIMAEKDAGAVRGRINALVEKRHGGPFEHSAMTFFVHCPVFVWREYHRHRIGHSFSEESARYKALEPVFYLPPRDRPMMKRDGFKAMTPGFDRCGSDSLYDALCNDWRETYAACYASYLRGLAEGIDNGLARIVLPVGIYSSGWVTVNPRSLMHFLSLRTHEPAARDVSYPLYEIEAAARVCEQTLKEGWPVTYECFNRHGRRAP
jgi:thymidylate synthase (FAD)